VPRAHREKEKEKVAKIRKAWGIVALVQPKRKVLLILLVHRLSEARVRRKVRRVISSGMKADSYFQKW